MRLVRENIDFKRGLDPKRALQIGRINLNIGDKISWDRKYFHSTNHPLGSKWITDEFDGTVVSITDDGPEVRHYDWSSGAMSNSIVSWDSIKKVNGDSILENIDFKRGLEPKKALGIGRRQKMFEPEYLMTAMTEDLDIMDSYEIISTGDTITATLYYNEEIKKRELSPLIYNWLYENTDVWTLSDVSDPTLAGSGYSKWWGVILLSKDQKYR